MRGFTLIEILIVIGIFGLLAILVWPPFMDFKRAESLRAATLEVESVLHQARSETLAARGGNSFGVSFQSDRVVLFAGESYDQFDPANRVTILPKLVTISDIDLSDNSTVIVFERLTGRAVFHGQIELSLITGSDKKQFVSVSPVGVIEVK